MTIRLVDDSPVQRAALAALLEQEGFAPIVQVGSAEDALVYLSAIRPNSLDLIVMDLHMPGMTGIEAISDGVPAFQKPESKNAAITLVTLGVLLTTMFLGISFLALSVTYLRPGRGGVV